MEKLDFARDDDGFDSWSCIDPFEGIVAIIELDNRTHDSGKDAKHEMLQSAGRIGVAPARS